MSDWWSTENSETHFSTFLLLLLPLLLAECSQKSPVSSTVSNLNSENPPDDSEFEKLFAVTHRLLLHGLRVVIRGAGRRPLHGDRPSRECCFLIDDAKLIILSRSCAGLQVCLSNQTALRPIDKL